MPCTNHYIIRSSLYKVKYNDKLDLEEMQCNKPRHCQPGISPTSVPTVLCGSRLPPVETQEATSALQVGKARGLSEPLVISQLLNCLVMLRFYQPLNRILASASR